MAARERHKPQDTVLYRVVREHLAEFLQQAREHHGGISRFIEKTLVASENVVYGG